MVTELCPSNSNDWFLFTLNLIEQRVLKMVHSNGGRPGFTLKCKGVSLSEAKLAGPDSRTENTSLVIRQVELTVIW